MQHLYTENYKTILREIKEDIINGEIYLVQVQRWEGVSIDDGKELSGRSNEK